MPEYTLDPIDTLRHIRQRQFRGDTLLCLDEDWGWKLYNSVLPQIFRENPAKTE